MLQMKVDWVQGGVVGRLVIMLTYTMYRVKGTTRSHSYPTICTNPGGKFVISLLMFHFTQTMPEAMLSTLSHLARAWPHHSSW